MDYKVLDEALAYINNESCENRYIYENLQEEFNLDLLLASAEESLLSEISGIILESESIEALNEGVRETIMNYVAKIVQGIQKAWNKFTNLFTQAELNHLKTKIKPAIDKAENIDFTINNYKYYNWDKFNEIDIVVFDYERMKDHLGSTTEFYSATYPNLDIANSKNLKDAFEKFLNKKIEDTKCDKNLINDIYDFASIYYFEYRKQIQKDIENLNNSNENIKNLVNSVVDSEKPVNASYEFKTSSQSTILEADNNGNNANGDQKTTFTDNSGETTKTDKSEQTKAENERRKSVTKAVTTYMTASTKLLSTKMSIINKGKREAFMILNHFYNSTKTNKTAVDGEKKVDPTAVPKTDTKIGKK